jgi:hypothetical protein
MCRTSVPMSDREAELSLMREICGAEDDAEIGVEQMDEEFNRLARNIATDMARAVQRSGTDGVWCYFCGASGVKLIRCDCGFGESFRCGERGRLTCKSCQDAHRSVGTHLERLFAAPTTNRVNGRKFRHFRELNRAVRSLYPDDADVTTMSLFCDLADIDEFENDAPKFRSAVLDAFRRNKFLDFAGLAQSLRREQDDSLIRSFVRSGLCR